MTTTRRHLLFASAGLLCAPRLGWATPMPMVLDALHTPGTSALGTRWLVRTDRTVGGTSDATLAVEVVQGEHCYRLRADLRASDNPPFVQLVLPLSGGSGTIDASAFAGVIVRVRGNGERYGLLLNAGADDGVAPQESFRAELEPCEAWSEVIVPWSDFVRSSDDEPVDPQRLQSIALAAAGRPMHVDLAVSYLALYR